MKSITSETESIELIAVLKALDMTPYEFFDLFLSKIDKKKLPSDFLI